VPVADLDSTAQPRRDDPLEATVVEDLPLGSHDHPADVPVAGQPPSPGGGDGGPEPDAGGAWPGGRVGQVVDVDHGEDVRLDRAQDRRLPGGEGDVGPLHQSVSQLLGAGAQVAGRAVGLHERLQHRLELLPADRVQLPAKREAAVGVLGDRHGALLGGIGLGAVGVQPGQVVLHDRAQVHVSPGGGGRGQHDVHRAQVDALLGGGCQVLRPRDRRDHGDLVGGDHAVGTAGRDGGQVFQHPAVAHDLVRRRGREPHMPLQPGRHRLQAVVLRHLGQLRPTSGTGQLGVDPVPRPHQQRRPVQHPGGGQAGKVIGGEHVQRRQQLAHDTSTLFDQVFEVYRQGGRLTTHIRRSARCPQIS
jgi:hypothetical protein